MRFAVVSRIAEQLALNNISKPLKVPFFFSTQPEDLAEYNPDVLYVHGLFINDYAEWGLYKQLMGSTKKVVIRFTGTDVLQITNFVERRGNAVLDWLKDDKFLLIPPSEAIAGELKIMGLHVVEPLNTPAERIFEPIPRPEKFTVGVYMPPHRQEFFNLQVIMDALAKVKNSKAIFYHFFPLLEDFEYTGGAYEKRFAMNRGEYEKTIADCSCLLRMPQHDANSISAAEFLMADRPVISNRDLPLWPAQLGKTPNAQDITKAIEKSRGAAPVSQKVRDYYLDWYNPVLWGEKLEKRCKDKWPEFSFV